MNVKFYLLRPFTNLHVGSGETNFGVIDNLIERDPVTGFPCVNSSGIKGSLKQMLHHNGLDENAIITIFGSDVAQNKGKMGDEKKFKQGKCHFFPAQLLALPVRTDKTPFILASCPSMLKQFLSSWHDLTGQDWKHKGSVEQFVHALSGKRAISPSEEFVGTELGGMQVTLESWDGKAHDQDLSKLFRGGTHPYCIVDDLIMMELCNDLNLPVIARNVLEDGESANLWYEQVLPRESLLYFAIDWADYPIDEVSEIENSMFNGSLQLGANASVGYGYTKISLLS